MANLPRFGRAWQRFSAAPRPVPAAQSASDQEPAATEPETTPAVTTIQSLQPFEPISPPPASEITPRLSSPAKKAASPISSPKPKATATRVASPPIKSARSPPSPAYKRYDGGRRISPTSSPKTTKTTSPRSPPKFADGTTTQWKITPEVDQKRILYQKIAAAKPAKSEGQAEYGSGKAAQKQQGDVINITGHNVGAVMEFSRSSGGGEMIRKKEREGGNESNDEKKMEAIMNSNFQSVNNSLLYDSSCNHRDPGLHLAFSGEQDDDGAIVDGSKDYNR